jgi:hypothetical protein
MNSSRIGFLSAFPGRLTTPTARHHEHGNKDEKSNHVPAVGTDACASPPTPEDNTTSISRASVNKDSAVFGFDAPLILTAREFCVGLMSPTALEF